MLRLPLVEDEENPKEKYSVHNPNPSLRPVNRVNKMRNYVNTLLFEL